MKWMKVIDRIENMMSKDFQHCSESQLIEVMTLKMQSIQFGLIVNLELRAAVTGKAIKKGRLVKRKQEKREEMTHGQSCPAQGKGAQAQQPDLDFHYLAFHLTQFYRKCDANDLRQNEEGGMTCRRGNSRQRRI
jgi:hypothetical protein